MSRPSQATDTQELPIDTFEQCGCDFKFIRSVTCGGPLHVLLLDTIRYTKRTVVKNFTMQDSQTKTCFSKNAQIGTIKCSWPRLPGWSMHCNGAGSGPRSAFVQQHYAKGINHGTCTSSTIC